MIEACKHGHVDGAMHIPCPQCADDYHADEITRLRAEIEMLRTGDTCARQCEGTAYRIEARNLKSENERLKADAERLDWINRQDFDNLDFTIFQDQPNDGMYGVSNGAGWAIGNTLREAIDAAMQKGGA